MIQNEIQLADLAHRRRVMHILCAATIILVALAVAFEFWLHFLSANMNASELVAVIKPMLGIYVMLMAACVVALGVYLVLRCKRIVHDQRYPPRDVPVIRDTPIREGADAVRLGSAGLIGGFALCALGLAVAVMGLLWVNQIG
jgi:hypothetical protein